MRGKPCGEATTKGDNQMQICTNAATSSNSIQKISDILTILQMTETCQMVFACARCIAVMEWGTDGESCPGVFCNLGASCFGMMHG